MKQEYTKYEATDFAEDIQFIRWIKLEEGDQKWQSWLRENQHKAEEVRLAREIVQSIQFKNLAGETNEDALWERIDAQTENTAISRRLPIVRWVSSIAAACLALLFAFWFFKPNSMNIQTKVGENMVYSLPDGSRVSLNANSQITYQNSDFPNKRRLRLHGEAFFNIVSGSPFVIATPQGTVEVLGTSFNVYARDKRFSVACKTGKVRVSRLDAENRILTAGLETHLKDRALTEPVEVELRKIGQWQNGFYHFEETRLRRVFEEIERQFKVEIEAPEAVQEKIGTIFFEKTELDSALYRVCTPMNLDYKIEEGKVFIEEKSMILENE